MRIGIVGLGAAGRRHTRNLISLGHNDLVAVRSSETPVPNDLASIPVVRSVQEAVDRGVCALIVCNPTSLHLRTALDGARHGCHLLIEKPLSNDTTGCAVLADEVERKGLVGMVAFNLRFHPALQQLKAMVQDGALGKILAFRAHVGQYLPNWRPDVDHRTSYSARSDLGGGVILDLIHEIDYVQWIVEPLEMIGCTTFRAAYLEIETEAIAEITATTRRGALGSIHLDYVDRQLIRRFRIIGTDGTAEWDQEKNRITIADVDGHREKDVSFDRNDTFIDQTRHFLSCIRGDALPPVSIREGIELLTVVAAAKRSAAEGRVIQVEKLQPA